MKTRSIALTFIIILLAVGGVFFRKEISDFWVTQKKDHPGTILTAENPGGKESVKNFEDVPLRHRFVFIKDGHEVPTREEADKAIPIVRVDIFRGPDGSILEMHEQGPKGESLRRTNGKE